MKDNSRRLQRGEGEGEGVRRGGGEGGGGALIRFQQKASLALDNSQQKLNHIQNHLHHTLQHTNHRVITPRGAKP